MNRYSVGICTCVFTYSNARCDGTMTNNFHMIKANRNKQVHTILRAFRIDEQTILPMAFMVKVDNIDNNIIVVSTMQLVRTTITYVYV